MKIGIQTWGSNGDVRPLLALADGLQKAGHQVTLVATCVDNQNYSGICEHMGIRYRQVPEHVAFDMEDFTHRSAKMNLVQWLRALLDESFLPYEQAMYQAAQNLVAEHDIVLGRHLLYPLKLAALKQNKPFYCVTFAPGAIPSKTQPPEGCPNLGPTFNLLCWKLVDKLFNLAMKKPLTRLWRAEGQIPPENILTELLTSQQLDLIAADPLFCLGSEGWQANHQICGFLNLTEDARQWTLPESLRAFLEQGPPPVYMTFGSLQQSAPEASMDLFARAVALAGCRAIVQTSSERYPAGSQSDNIYFISKHPHQPVFERCAAVVHHGGAGTTHAATRAGCPSVVVPFIDEQKGWGMSLQRLGLAVAPLPFKSVTAESLAKALCAVLTPEYKARAEQAGRTMQTSDGVAKAVAAIERCFQGAS